MIKKLIQLAVLVFLVWYFQIILEVILPFPSESLFQECLESDSETVVDMFSTILMICRYAVWMVFIAILIKYTRPVLGFFLPLGRRFGTTKLMRRAQGVYAQLVMIVMIAVLFGSVFIINPSISFYNKAIAEQMSIETDNYYDNIFQVRANLNDEVRDNRYKALSFISSNQHNYIIPDGIWPLDNGANIEEYSSDAELGNWWNNLRSKVSGYFNDTQTDIRKTVEYKTYFKNQKSLKRRLKNAKAQRIDEIDISKKARANVKALLGNPVQNTLSAFRTALIWILPLSIIIYILIRVFVKRVWFAKLSERIIGFLHKSRFGSGGSARFAGMIEEWLHLYKNQMFGLYLGRSMYSTDEIGLEDPRHMVTFGMTRSGKGAEVIIPNLLSWQHGSAVVLDVKGTNAIVTANARRAMGHDVHVIDPFGITKEKKSTSFNILDSLNPDSETIREEIKRVAEALVVRPKEERDPHWNDGAEMVISGLIAHLISSPEFQNPHLGMLRDLISQSKKDQIKLWSSMAFNDEAGGLARDAGFRISNGFETEEITNILSNVSKHISWLASSAIQKIIKNSSFKIQDVKNKPTTVYLVLPPHLLTTHNRFLRLFINSVLNEMSVGGKAKIPVLMMMDEFLALDRLKEIEESFPLMAGYNLILWPFIQSLAGLESLYGKESSDAFLSGSRAIQVFGVAGPSSLEYVSKHLGMARSKKDKSRTVPMRDPSEVAAEVSKESGLQYILRAGKPAMILERVPYYDSAPYGLLSKLPIPLFKGRFDNKYDPDPDYA